MKWFNILRDRLRALRQRESVINEIDREMRSHLELQVEANIREGMSPTEAREKAMRSFGKSISFEWSIPRNGRHHSVVMPRLSKHTHDFRRALNLC